MNEKLNTKNREGALACVEYILVLSNQLKIAQWNELASIDQIHKCQLRQIKAEHHLQTMKMARTLKKYQDIARSFESEKVTMRSNTIQSADCNKNNNRREEVTGQACSSRHVDEIVTTRNRETRELVKSQDQEATAHGQKHKTRIDMFCRLFKFRGKKTL